MARSNILQKRAANLILDKLAAAEWAPPLPSASEMARRIEVSRTTVRGALRHLLACGVVARPRDGLTIVRQPRRADYFSETETSGPRALIERTFMQRVLLGDWQPGRQFSETDLARDSGASAASVREFLIGFSRFHLVEKRPRGGWCLLGLDAALAGEVADMRAIVETAAIGRSPKQPGAAWIEQVDDLIARHEALTEKFEQDYLSFPSLDRDFHLWLIAHLQNRFARDLYDVVSFVFHYHYQWNKSDERERNRVAVGEHLRILHALRSGDIEAARARLAEHLATSRASFVRSVRAIAAGPDRPRRRAPVQPPMVRGVR
jgi:DNA-binding GntR family transcriptional regulator